MKLWQHLGLPECPYMSRIGLDCKLFSVRLHRWRGSDDDRAFHDHPWWFLTCVLWGKYVDVSPAGEDLLTAGSIRFRPAHHQHTVKILRPTWTLVLTGPPSRRWGFWVKGKLVRRDTYFARHGHHPCDGGEAVRMHPSGARISPSERP